MKQEGWQKVPALPGAGEGLPSFRGEEQMRQSQSSWRPCSRSSGRTLGCCSGCLAMAGSQGESCRRGIGCKETQCPSSHRCEGTVPDVPYALTLPALWMVGSLCNLSVPPAAQCPAHPIQYRLASHAASSVAHPPVQHILCTHPAVSLQSGVQLSVPHTMHPALCTPCHALHRARCLSLLAEPAQRHSQACSTPALLGGSCWAAIHR